MRPCMIDARGFLRHWVVLFGVVCAWFADPSRVVARICMQQAVDYPGHAAPSVRRWKTLSMLRKQICLGVLHVDQAAGCGRRAPATAAPASNKIPHEHLKPAEIDKGHAFIAVEDKTMSAAAHVSLLAGWTLQRSSYAARPRPHMHSAHALEHTIS